MKKTRSDHVLQSIRKQVDHIRGQLDALPDEQTELRHQLQDLLTSLDNLDRTPSSNGSHPTPVISESNLKTVLETISDAVTIYDTEGKIVQANAAAINLFGFDPFDNHTQVEKNRSKIKYLDGSPIRREDLALFRALAGETIRSERFRYINALGREFIIEVAVAPLWDGDKIVGAVSNWSGVAEIPLNVDVEDIVHDHLEQHLIEQTSARRDSEARFRLLVTATSDAIYQMSADWSQMFNLKGMDFIADTENPSRTWLDKYVPSDEQTRVLSAVQDAIENKHIFELEHQVIRADGTIGWTFSRAVPLLNQQKEITEWFGIATDVTERKRAEERIRENEEQLRELFSTWAQAVWTTDATGIVTEDSPSWRMYTGQSLEEWLGEGWTQAIHPDDRERALTIWREAAREVKPFNIEYRLKSPNGQWRWTNARAVPLLNTDQSVNKWAGMNIDITERKRREAILAFLADYSEKLITLSTPAEIVAALGERLHHFIGASACAFIQIDEAKHEARIDNDWHQTDTPSLTATYDLDEYVTANFRETMSTGQVVVIRDIQRDPLVENAARFAPLKIGALVNVPLIRDGKWKFTLGVFHQQPYDWHEDEIELLLEVINRIWDKLERALAEAKLLESEQQLQLSVKVSQMGTFVWYPSEDRTEPDARMMELFGLPLDGLLNLQTALATMIHPDDRQRYAAAVARAIDPVGNGVLQEDIRVLIRDGTQRWLAILGQVFFEGTPPRATRMVGGATNITARKRLEEQLRRNAERDAFLIHLSDVLRPLYDPVAIQAEASRLLGEYLGVQRVAYAEVIGEEGIIRQDYAQDVPSIKGRHQIRNFGATLVAALQRGETVVIHNLDQYGLGEIERATYAALNICAYIGVSLIKDGQWVGTMGVYTTQPRNWTPDEVTLLQETAERTWAAVERARAEKAVADDLQAMQVLLDLSARLVSEDNIQVFYEEIRAAAVALMHADTGTVQMLDEATQELVMQATHGFSKSMVEYFDRVDAASSTSCGAALATGKRTFVRFDVPENEDPDGSLRMHFDEGYILAQSTPLITRSGKPIGMFSTHWKHHYQPTERELRFLDLLARQAADLIERVRAEKALSASEERYRTLFNSIDEGFTVIKVLFDGNDKPLDYQFLEANPAFERQTGLENALGKTVRQFVPAHEEYWFEIYGKVATTGEPIRFENRADQLHRFYDVFAFRVGEPDERTVAVLFNDISERKRRELNNAFLAEISGDLARLSSSSELIQTVGPKLGTYLKSSFCYLVDVNEATDQAQVSYIWNAFNLPPLPTSLRISDFVTGEFHRAARAGETIVVRNTTTDPVTSDTAEALAALHVHSFVAVPLHKGDEWKFLFTVCDSQPREWFEDEIELIKELASRIFLRLERARAEEALQESEERYRNLFNSVDEGYILVDVIFDEQDQPIDILYVDANPAAVRMTGTEVAGKRARQIDPNYEQQWYEIFGRVAKTGVSERHELSTMSSNVWYSFYAFKVGGLDTPRVGVVYQDITERKRREQIEEQVQALNRERLVVAETLRDTASELNSSLQLDEVLEKALAAAHRLVGHEIGFVALIENGRVTDFCSEGLTPTHHRALEDWHRTQNPLKDAALYRSVEQPKLIKARGKTKDLPTPIAAARSVLVLPITRDNNLMGYVTLVNQHEEMFDALDFPKLEAFAFQLSAAIANANQYVQGQELAVLQERQKLARDLHDDVTQTLFSASILTQGLLRQWERNREMVPGLLVDVNRLVRGAMAEMRTLLLELRPSNVETTPFSQLLQQLATAVQGRKEIEVKVNFEGEPTLSPEIRLGIYRIAQEAINNITKHSRATEAWVEGRGGHEHIELHIRDNGIGFTSDNPSTGLGLQIMRERAQEIDARLEIRSQVSGGTDVYVIWPKQEPPRFYPPQAST